jgi:hypothetical protein
MDQAIAFCDNWPKVSNRWGEALTPKNYAHYKFSAALLAMANNNFQTINPDENQGRILLGIVGFFILLWSLSSHFFFLWDFVKRHPSLIAALIGGIGQSFFDWQETTGKHKFWKNCFTLLLAASLVVSLVEAANADKETAGIESDNLVLRTNVLALQIQLAEVTNNVARMDPRSQPITSFSASATLDVRFGDGSNGTHVESRARGDGTVAELTFFNGKDKHDIELHFVGKDFHQDAIDFPFLATVTIPFQPVNAIDFRMSRAHWPASIPISTIGQNVDFMDHLDSASLKLYFMPITAFYGANATIILNSTPKTFSMHLTSGTNFPILYSCGK